MSKSFSISFEQSFRLVISEETIALIRQELSCEVDPARQTDAQRAFHKVMKDWLQKGDDEFLALFLKFAIRTTLRDAVVEMITKDQAWEASKFAPAKVSVTPRVRPTKPEVACVVPDPACDCNFCRSF